MSYLRTLLLTLSLGVGSLYAETAKVVYDLTTGDSKKIEKYVINSLRQVAKHYKEEGKTFDAIVVISGDAYKFFIEELEDSPYADEQSLREVQYKIKPLLQELDSTYHVTFNMCSNGMSARDIEPESLYRYVHAEKMKSVYLIDAQNRGYAYMSIH